MNFNAHKDYDYNIRIVNSPLDINNYNIFEFNENQFDLNDFIWAEFEFEEIDSKKHYCVIPIRKGILINTHIANTINLVNEISKINDKYNTSLFQALINVDYLKNVCTDEDYTVGENISIWIFASFVVDLINENTDIYEEDYEDSLKPIVIENILNFQYFLLNTEDFSVMKFLRKDPQRELDDYLDRIIDNDKKKDVE